MTKESPTHAKPETAPALQPPPKQPLRIGQVVTYSAQTRLGVNRMCAEIMAMGRDGSITLSVLTGENDADDALRVIAVESESGAPGTFRRRANE